MLNFKIIKWMGLNPLIKPTITVALIKESGIIKPIDYSEIKHMETVKVGTHLSDFNSSPVSQMISIANQ